MTPLQQANQAHMSENYAQAIALYVRVLQQYVPLAKVLVGNLQRAQRAYRAQRLAQGGQTAPHVLVSCWDLSHNAAGRATTLAQIWAGIGKTEIIGFLYPPQKSKLWEPIQDFSLPIHPLHVQPDLNFIEQVLDFVLAHPCDLLHLSKPRWPNIVLGVIYKLVWACPVWMDIDDEELAFVKADSPIDLGEYLKSGGFLPLSTDSLSNATSTRLAVGLATAFDQVTVVNSALQHRYGGTIVHHARDPKYFSESFQHRRQVRGKLGIKPDDIVIIFAGTPRAHKGLLETAQAIVQQRRKDLVFLIVGDFPKNLSCLQQKIVSMPGLRSIMLPNQPFEKLPDVLAAGDICVLLQDTSSDVAKYQTPAKLTDALAMGLTVLATLTPSLADFALQSALIPVVGDQLPQVLASILVNRQLQPVTDPASHPLFKQQLTISANQVTLSKLWCEAVQSASQGLNTRLQDIALGAQEISSITALSSER